MACLLDLNFIDVNQLTADEISDACLGIMRMDIHRQGSILERAFNPEDKSLQKIAQKYDPKLALMVLLELDFRHPIPELLLQDQKSLSSSRKSSASQTAIPILTTLPEIDAALLNNKKAIGDLVGNEIPPHYLQERQSLLANREEVVASQKAKMPGRTATVIKRSSGLSEAPEGRRGMRIERGKPLPVSPGKMPAASPADLLSTKGFLSDAERRDSSAGVKQEQQETPKPPRPSKR
jgi:hypothetical protein